MKIGTQIGKNALIAAGSSHCVNKEVLESSDCVDKEVLESSDLDEMIAAAAALKEVSESSDQAATASAESDITGKFDHPT